MTDTNEHFAPSQSGSTFAALAPYARDGLGKLSCFDCFFLGCALFHTVSHIPGV